MDEELLLLLRYRRRSGSATSDILLLVGGLRLLLLGVRTGGGRGRRGALLDGCGGFHSYRYRRESRSGCGCDARRPCLRGLGGDVPAGRVEDGVAVVDVSRRLAHPAHPSCREGVAKSVEGRVVVLCCLRSGRCGRCGCGSGCGGRRRSGGSRDGRGDGGSGEEVVFSKVELIFLMHLRDRRTGCGTGERREGGRERRGGEERKGRRQGSRDC